MYLLFDELEVGAIIFFKLLSGLIKAVVWMTKAVIKFTTISIKSLLKSIRLHDSE